MGTSIKKFADEMSAIMPNLHREFLKKQLRITVTSSISFQQIVILNLLSEKGQRKMNEIAKLLSVTTSAATGMVGRMVRAGFFTPPIVRCADSVVLVIEHL